jgi:hypothetical protein
MMSFESAQKILQMYYQTNQQRINASMEMAYNEALSRFKSESAAREAALEILAEEEKSWRAYQKEIAQIRREQMKGNIQIAKINSERAFYNAKEQAKVNDINAMRKYKKGEKQAEISAIAGVKFKQLTDRTKQSATDYADQQATSKGIFNSELEAVTSNLIGLLQDRKATDTDVYRIAHTNRNQTLHGGLDKARRMSELTQKDATLPEGADKDLLGKIRLKDLGNQILEQVASATGRDLDDPRIKYLHELIFEGSSVDPVNATGRLNDVLEITDADQSKAYNLEYNSYYNAYKPVMRGGSIRIKGDPPMKEAILKEEIELSDLGGEDLARRASDVFDALNARDDTPFEIDAEERKSISQDAFDAYEELKRVVPKDPLAVTFEERTLLDDAALERQLSILRQRQQIGRMSPYMASPEVIRARAGELLEPGAKRTQINIPASAQRYYATENEAFKLSDRSDLDVQNMGVPEQAGVSLYKEMFDPTQGTLKDGQQYDQVLNRINEFFPENKEQQLRAISAFNSRAMALQRSRNPLVMKDGEQNIDYLEALKALGK